MLLTNLPVENVDDAKRILRYYIRRWENESEGLAMIELMKKPLTLR
jgi:hypothetical protein